MLTPLPVVLELLEGRKRADAGSVEIVVDLQKRELVIFQKDDDAADDLARSVQNCGAVGDRAWCCVCPRCAWLHLKVYRGTAAAAVTDHGGRVHLRKELVAALEVGVAEDREECDSLDR